MLDHIGFPVSNFKRSKAFYQAALAPLGITLLMEIGPETAGKDSHAGFGREGRPKFWIGTGAPLSDRLHVAFEAKDKHAVDAFHAAALQAGGKDNGPPGPRPQYHTHYYGAFVLDPDGHNIEAVCHSHAV
jgi:catechol 2,3-dioxygenase-like lactoylglutathione lyase family enzyme